MAVLETTPPESAMPSADAVWKQMQERGTEFVFAQSHQFGTALNKRFGYDAMVGVVADEGNLDLAIQSLSLAHFGARLEQRPAKYSRRFAAADRQNRRCSADKLL